MLSNDSCGDYAIFKGCALQVSPFGLAVLGYAFKGIARMLEESNIGLYLKFWSHALAGPMSQRTLAAAGNVSWRGIPPGGCQVLN
jgi:hypothetical protein